MNDHVSINRTVKFQNCLTFHAQVSNFCKLLKLYLLYTKVNRVCK